MTVNGGGTLVINTGFTASAATVDGQETIALGAVADGVTAQTGGIGIIAGTVIDAVIDESTLELAQTTVVSGGINFDSGSSILTIDEETPPTAAMSGFAVGDRGN